MEVRHAERTSGPGRRHRFASGPPPIADRSVRMKSISALMRLLAPGVSSEAIRLEIYLLGSRHQGEALKGARLELASVGLDGAGIAKSIRAVISE